jgi:hypothetical protein
MQMNGNLGFVEYLSAGAALLNAGKKGGSAGGSGAPGIMVNTSTNVTTQVSPQISPQFIQQSSPQNSPVTAGAGMGVPQVGNIPGIDYGIGGALPAQPMQAGINPAVIAGIGIVLLGLLVMRKKAQ